MGKGKKKRAELKEQQQALRRERALERNFRNKLQSKRKRGTGYDDPSWKTEIARFRHQLQALGLRIRDIPGDGNCLFRAACDQLKGNLTEHLTIRTEVMKFIEQHRDDFAPFVEDDEPFDRYVSRMKKQGEWGGNLELQAISLRYAVNITIHQLDAPRFEIVNFPPNARTIHLSYHDGDHYNSVRSIDETDDGIPREPRPLAAEAAPAATHAKEAKQKGKDKSKKPAPAAQGNGLTPTYFEQYIMDTTLFTDLATIRQMLEANGGDVDAAIDFIVSANLTAAQPPGVSSPSAPPAMIAEASATTTTTTSVAAEAASAASTTDHAGNHAEEPSGTAHEKVPESGAQQKREKEKAVEKEGEKGKDNKEKPKEANDEKGQAVHPKLQKFEKKKLSNRERKRQHRLEKEAREKEAIQKRREGMAAAVVVAPQADGPAQQDKGAIMI